MQMQRFRFSVFGLGTRTRGIPHPASDPILRRTTRIRTNSKRVTASCEYTWRPTLHQSGDVRNHFLTLTDHLVAAGHGSGSGFRPRFLPAAKACAMSDLRGHDVRGGGSVSSRVAPAAVVNNCPSTLAVVLPSRRLPLAPRHGPRPTTPLKIDP